METLDGALKRFPCGLLVAKSADAPERKLFSTIFRRHRRGFGIIFVSSNGTAICQAYWTLDKDGYTFFFYSNEHESIHVHVKVGAGKAKFDVSDEVQLLESKGMKVQELRKAQDLAEENAETIRRKWHEYFD